MVKNIIIFFFIISLTAYPSEAKNKDSQSQRGKPLASSSDKSEPSSSPEKDKDAAACPCKCPCSPDYKGSSLPSEPEDTLKKTNSHGRLIVLPKVSNRIR
jgi:hypothetical protein